MGRYVKFGAKLGAKKKRGGPKPAGFLSAFMCAAVRSRLSSFVEEPVMKLVVGAVLCTAAVIGQISTASAQYYGQPGGYYYEPPGGYYYYGSPAGIYHAQLQIEQDLGWNYTRNQPVGYGGPYPATRMPDGTLACEYSNYRPIHGRCQRIW